MEMRVHVTHAEHDDEENEARRLLSTEVENSDELHQEKTIYPEEKDVGCCSWNGKASLNRLFFSRLWRLLCILRAYPALILPLISILNAHVVSRVGKITGKFYAVFLDGNRSDLWSLVLRSTVLFLFATSIYALMSFLADAFAFLWRRRLTSYLMDRYTHNHAFYWLRDVDNPDQRIAQDLSHWSITLSKILKDLASVPYNLIYYTAQVYKQLRSIKVLLAVYLWFMGGALLLKVLIGPSANLLFAQEVEEGNFRAALMRVKTCKTEIAASQAENLERQNLYLPFHSVLFYQLRVVLWNSLITFTSRVTKCISLKLENFVVYQALDYMGTLLNFTCIGLVIFSGGFSEATSGGLTEQISNTSFYLLMLVNSVSNVQDCAKSFSELAGLTPRVSQLVEQLDKFDEETEERKERKLQSPDHTFLRLDTDGEVILRLQHLSCWTLGNRLIVQDLTLLLKRGESLLISGPSGVGKSTLLLTLMELCESYKGDIKTIPTDHIMMLPQQSIVAPGRTLASQLMYPKSNISITEDRVMELMREVGLEEVVRTWCGTDLSTEKNWKRIFSSGELQRVALARALFHKPDLLLLDESTSALPAELEMQIYARIKERNIGVVSVGHKESLKVFHDWLLCLHGDIQGQWTLTRLSSNHG